MGIINLILVILTPCLLIIMGTLIVSSYWRRQAINLFINESKVTEIYCEVTKISDNKLESSMKTMRTYKTAYNEPQLCVEFEYDDKRSVLFNITNKEHPRFQVGMQGYLRYYKGSILSFSDVSKQDKIVKEKY